MNEALPVDGQVDRIIRLQRDPPVEWERTAWGTDTIDGETVLVETVVVPCPSCGEGAYWASGRVACAHCETRQRMVG
jgi:hypothetical protein